MVSANRNFDLEEINTDLIDLPYIKHQTFLQKVIFVGGIAAGIGAALILTFMDVSPIVNSLIFIVSCSFAVIFGGNYNEDLSLWKYLVLRLTKKGEYLRPSSTEDGAYLESLSADFEKSNIEKSRDLKLRDPGAQKKMLKVLIIIIVLFASLITGVFLLVALKKGREDNGLHHEAAIVREVGI